MAPPLPDPEAVARAYELSLQYPTRQVREMLGNEGHPISLSTTYEWIRQGRDAAAVVEVLGLDEERRRANGRLDICMGIVVDALRTRGADPLEVVDRILKVEARRAALLGLDAPKRIAVSEDRELPSVDPRTVEAVKAAQERALAEERTLRRDTHEVWSLPAPDHN